MQSGIETQTIKKQENRGGRRPGAGRPKGYVVREKSKDAARIALIEKRLSDHFTGAIELDTSQVKAAEVLYARLRPSLSAVEQTNVDPRDLGDPNALLSQMVAALAANPLLVARLRAALEQAEQQAAELAGVAIANASAITQQSEGDKGDTHGVSIMSKANAKQE